MCSRVACVRYGSRAEVPQHFFRAVDRMGYIASVPFSWKALGLLHSRWATEGDAVTLPSTAAASYTNSSFQN